MAIVAYYGHPNSRLFGRVTFSSEEQARMALWNDSTLFDLHDTDERTSYWDKRWAETQPTQAALRPVHQLALPGFEPAATANDRSNR